MSLQVDVGHMPNGSAGYFDDGTHACPVCSVDRSHGRIARPVTRKLSREQQMRLAVLLLFCDPVPEQCSHLLELSDKDWEKLLWWMDLSGLALYFLDRIVSLKLCNLLPRSVFTRLHLNLIDNTERTRRMLLESAAIQLKFQRVGISYAVLKGISLWPSAVPKPELRSQFDMDYLVAETDLPAARRILETDGYRLYAVSGKSWEFKKNERPGVSLKDIYKHFGSYGVELHAVKRVGEEESALNRIQKRDVNGTSMPVLDPVDLFLGHGMHTFKHLCGEYARASQFLEFRRHVLRFQDDENFWLELRRVADGNLRVSLGLGVVLLLISEVMGNFVPYGLASWTVDQLPDRLRLWVRTYGHRAILGEFPGTKLYLLLQQELEECGVVAKRATRDSLFPAQLPPPVIRPVANEGLDRRVRRYAMHLGTILNRAQFHLTEGVRYAVETRRWRRIKESVR